MNQKQVQKRYYKEFVIAMGAYMIVLITSITMLQRVELSSPLRIITALSPAIPVAFVIIAIMRAMRNSD